MKNLSLDKMKNKTAATAAATIAAAGVLIGGSFDAPADIMKNDDAAPAPPPIVEVLEARLPDGDPSPDGDGDGNAAADEEERKRGGLRERVRARVMKLPSVVRACVVVPLWGVGWLILSVLSALWAGVLSPVGGAFLRWVVLALMILAALAVTVKSVFPNTPLKKILNKRTLLWVLGGSTLFCIADVLLRRFAPGLPRLYDVARIVASSALLLSALIPSLRGLKKERDRREAEERAARETLRAAQAEEPEETPEQAQARAEREVLALADSVSLR